MSDDMRITNITIHNFKSLYDISFEPGNVNVLIGANGSGKSSVLDTISSAISEVCWLIFSICEAIVGLLAAVKFSSVLT